MADDDIQTAPAVGAYEFTADQEKAMRDSSAANRGAYQGGDVQPIYEDKATGKVTYGPKQPLMVTPISPREF